MESIRLKQVCDWNLLPHSLEASSTESSTAASRETLDRFLTDVEYARRHPKSLFDLLRPDPRAQGNSSFWEFIQGRTGNYWTHRILASLSPPRQRSLSNEDKIRFSEQDCRFYPLVREEIEIPWLNCWGPSLPELTELRRWITVQSEKISGELLSNPLGRCNHETQLMVARRFFEALSEPPHSNGLGLAFDDTPRSPHRGLTEVVRDRKATCAEFVSLFLFISRELGIPATPIAEFPTAGGTESGHLLIGFVDPRSGKLLAVADHGREYFGNPDAGKNLWIPISRTDFVIYLFNLRGARDPDQKKGEAMIDRALVLNPRHYLSLYNKAFFLGSRGNFQAAQGLLFDSLRDFPSFTPSYHNIAYFAQVSGDEVLKLWALNQERRLMVEAETDEVSASIP